jgi:hypothetical protein
MGFTAPSASTTIALAKSRSIIKMLSRSTEPCKNLDAVWRSHRAPAFRGMENGAAQTSGGPILL